MGWDAGSLGPPISRVEVELYTSAYRVSGHMLTRFRRVADILNLAGSTHLIVEGASVVEYADPGSNRGGQAVMVAVQAVLFGISSGGDDSPTPDLIVQKRPVQIQVAMHPFWLTGTIHVPYGSQPVDVLNVADPFLPLTGVAVNAASFPGFDGEAPILAVQRALAEVMIITDTAGPDQPRPDDSGGQADFAPDPSGTWLPPTTEDSA